MSANMLDIGTKSSYPAGDLSNFTAFKFTLDGVECASMEGFLQALKFDKPHIQVEVCKLTGVQAKHRGKERNVQWKTKQALWWNGEIFCRKSDEYQLLIDRAYLELAKANEKFRQAILDTGDLILTHRIGRTSESKTVLTQVEFCSRLMKLRKLLRNGVDLNTVKRL
jgi:predicted NAD-dependent protein-ADP-ribosyltransferase YbiA (DUF1768 family)